MQFLVYYLAASLFTCAGFVALLGRPGDTVPRDTARAFLLAGLLLLNIGVRL